MDLSPQERQALAVRIELAIDDYAIKTYDDGHRNHLGASLIGHECPRYLWLVFRWCKRENFSGRMLRLFQRGHLEEARFVEYLRGIGFEVSEQTPEGKQHRVSACMGHFGGSLDGLARENTKALQDIEEDDAIEDDFSTFLLEFKTSGTGSGFNSMKEKGVRRSKPRHWAQMCVYGALRKIKYAIYCCVCKNDDELHVEVVELDHNYGDELIAKAEAIFRSQEAPNRIAQTPAFHVCKFCHMKGICFEDEAPEKNCRSCKYANPVENAKWLCAKYKDVIPAEYIKEGCEQWERII